MLLLIMEDVNCCKKMYDHITKNNISKSIAWLRFPLIILVVMIHAKLVGDHIGGSNSGMIIDNIVLSKIEFAISDVIASIAVPLFFAISGYLFLHGDNSFSRQIYINKLKKRAATILVPYIIWNMITLLMFILAERFMPSMRGATKFISDYSFTDFYGLFGIQTISIIFLVLDFQSVCNYGS